MVEALTESFCERCGTRYEFSAPTRLTPLRKTRGLISGLRNYIMSQEALGDAVGDAMRSEESQLASQQLDAFHESFNFCIDCRQYTCVNCWNEDAGRCRSCVPVPGTDDLLERFESTFHAGHPELAGNGAGPGEMSDAELQARLGVEAWPSADLASEPAPAPPVPDIPWPDEPMLATQPSEPVEEPVPPLAGDLPEPPVVAEEPAPMLAEEIHLPAVIEAPEPVAAEEPAAAQPEPEPVAAIAWEMDETWEMVPEPVMAAEPEPEPMLAEEPEPEPVAAVEEPEPMLAEEAEPEPEPVAAAEEPEPMLAEEPEPEPVAAVEEPPSAPAPPVRPTPIRPVSETIVHLPRPLPQAARPPAPAEEAPMPAAAQADDAALAARRAQLDLLGLGDPGEGPVAPTRPNVLPYRSRGAAPTQAELETIASVAPAVSRGFWEASAREVASATAQVGVQSCGECGLSLSASARFCRRCGTRQARSA